MFCMECGKKIPDVAKFCIFCGTAVDAEVLSERATSANVSTTESSVVAIPNPVMEEFPPNSMASNEELTMDVGIVTVTEDQPVAEETILPETTIKQNEQFITNETPEEAAKPIVEPIINTEEESPAEGFVLGDENAAKSNTVISEKCFCTNCGTELSLDDTFCFNCGKKVEQSILTTTVPQEQSPIERMAEVSTEPQEEIKQQPEFVTISVSEEARQSEGTSESVIKSVFCIHCGNKLLPEDMFCNQCGAKIETIKPLEAVDVKKPTDDEIKNSPAPVELGSGVQKDFLQYNDYIIDEKLSIFKFTNAYTVYGIDGNVIGAVEQCKLSAGATAARILVGRSVKSMQSFRLMITDSSNRTVAAIERGTGIYRYREVSIFDGENRQIGTLRAAPDFSKEIYHIDNTLAARIKGDWKGWNFQIQDANGGNVGTINKSWNGVAKELFTTADKYRVSISPDLSDKDRRLVVAAAITIDMVLHEWA